MDITYICTKQLPEGLESLQSCVFTFPDKANIDCLPRIGRRLGIFYEDTGETRSLLIVDQNKPFEETILSKLLSGGEGLLQRRGITIFRQDEPQKSVNAIAYLLTYENPQARCLLPTVNMGICRACNVETDFTYEIALADDDGWHCFIYVDVKTGGMGSMTLLDELNHLESLLETPEELAELVPGSRYDDTTIFMPFGHDEGDFIEREFSHSNGNTYELKDMLYSIRLVKNECKIK